ncbi:hypothetical protein DPMN_159962 [Dreissena polymorpha]|uniref:Uncharacterized protein n=1 Tax=Dreissena polymorpha TaxID=45954 RepID=A0A9D4EP90_DREPO|nr:hypothetical protein DPMN_159962 [Dreissena polymorpha]
MKRTLGQELSTVLRKLNFQEHGKRKQRGKGRKNRLTLLSTSPKKLGLKKKENKRTDISAISMSFKISRSCKVGRKGVSNDAI